MASSSTSLPTSKAPTPASRAAARARMRARASAARANGGNDRLNSGESPIKIDDTRSLPTILPQQHRPHYVQNPSRNTLSISCGEASWTATSPPNTASPSIPNTRPKLSAMTALPSPILREADYLLAEEKDPGHDIRVTRLMEETQGHTSAPLIHVRPTVKLYQHEGEEALRDKQEDVGSAGESVDTSPESDCDAPYIPGRGAENTRRCLTWLRNVGTDEDSLTPERERSS
ncbi:hypothetical protein HYPSUDRAFT_56547 [Hypholoma sublateritium FD-334 SS-4]|uniref:Uncharacterized protein n=1 Tax=Hypholoma sublateritium (strain FD-334 SS-4) TaxID=945553 RepID=A0A0D2PHL6_HYPSF|nr:hypothetical protein HYPSUDRAFT_56547 [Hypholoma sublateritium FD-334 SS-4]